MSRFGLKPFALEADQIGDPNRRLRFVIGRAATIKVAVAFSELKWIEAPVFPFGFDHVAMRQQEQGSYAHQCRDNERRDSPYVALRRQ